MSTNEYQAEWIDDDSAVLTSDGQVRNGDPRAAGVSFSRRKVGSIVVAFFPEKPAVLPSAQTLGAHEAVFLCETSAGAVTASVLRAERATPTELLAAAAALGVVDFGLAFGNAEGVQLRVALDGRAFATHVLYGNPELSEPWRVLVTATSAAGPG